MQDDFSWAGVPQPTTEDTAVAELLLTLAAPSPSHVQVMQGDAEG